MKLINFVVITVGIIMSLTFFSVVILRYGFNANLFAYEEWLMALCFWMFFMASAAATHDKLHVNADILGFMITNPRAIWVRSIVVFAIELIVLSFVIYWGWLMVFEEIAQYPNWQATIALDIPFLVPRFGIFIGLLLMGVYTVLHLIVLIRTGPSTNETKLEGTK